MAVVVSCTFETNANNHVAWFGATVARNTADAHAGTASLLVTQTDAFAGVQLDNWPYFPGITAGNDYDVSLWYKEATATMPTVAWEIFFYNDGGTNLGSTVVNLPRATTWTEATTTLTAPTGATRIGWTLATTTGNGSAWRIDDVVVEDAVSGTSGELGTQIPLPTAGVTGTVSAVGDATSALPLPTAEVTGTASADGAIAAALPLPTSGLAGEVSTAGALAADVLAPTAAIAGGETAVDGALAGSLLAPAAAIAGTVSMTGALAAAGAVPTAELVGDVQWDLVWAEIEGIIPLPTGSFAGVQSLTGALGASMPRPTSFFTFLPPPPASRTVVVTAESRTLAAAAESRTLAVPAESRTLAATPSDTRTLTA